MASSDLKVQESYNIPALLSLPLIPVVTDFNLKAASSEACHSMPL